MPERELIIEIEGRDRTGGMWRDTGRQASQFGETLRSVGRIAGGVLAADAVRGGLSALQTGFSSSVEAAVNLGESVNAVERIFGDAASEMLDFSRTSANSIGLSQAAFNQAIVPLGAMLSNAGLEMDAVADATVDLTERAADMASVFNTDVDQALAAITAGLRGETDPLEQFGVSINAAAVEARALADSGKAAAADLTSMELASARVALILEQTDSVAGDFAETSDELANSTRIAKAEMEDQRAEIGDRLIPIQQEWVNLQLEASRFLTERLIPALDRAAEWYREHIAPAIEAVRDATSEWLDEQGGVEGIMARARDALSPVVDGFEEFKASLRGAIDNITPIVEEHGPELVRMFEEEWPAIEEALTTVIEAVGAGLELLGQIIETATVVMEEIWDAWGDEIIDITEGTWEAVNAATLGALENIVNLLRFFTALFAGDWKGMGDALLQMTITNSEMTIAIFLGLWQAVSGIVQGLARAVVVGMRPITSTVINVRRAYNEAMMGLTRATNAAGAGIAAGAAWIAEAAIRPFRGMPGRLAEAGRAAWQALRDALESGFAPLITTGQRLASTVSRFLPGSPVETGPLTVLNRGRAGRAIVDMIRDGMESRRDALRNSARSVVAPVADATTSPVAGLSGSHMAPDGGTIVIDLRGAVLPSDQGFRDLVVDAIESSGRVTRGRVAVRGRELT